MNLTTDVQLAAHAIEQGADMYSNDADFGRFPGLSWVDPLKQR
jgi:predicted nucleic acid-binding protein